MDEQARAEFRDYVAASTPLLLRVAYLMTGDQRDAEDLVQSALTKTYLAWPRIRHYEALDAYVRRIMLNARTSAWRRSRGTRWVPLETTEGEYPPVMQAQAQADAVELRESLRPALMKLTRRQRNVVILRYYLDLSEAETARVLGISIGTVKSTSWSAIHKLRGDSTIGALARCPRAPEGAV